MKIYRILIFVLFLLCLFLKVSDACTTFLVEDSDHYYFGRSYDFEIGKGYIMVNKRNVKKSTLVLADSIEWTSKYGSVTFNQFGREMPLGGINETGLVIENMWLDETVYPENDSRPETSSLQWIQYQLDNHSTVDEVIASDSDIRISRETAGTIHFLIADCNGDCAIIEFLDGKMVVHKDENLPYRVLTNDTYKSSLEFLSQHDGFGGEVPIPDGKGSLDRFVRASNMVSNFSNLDYETPVDGAFDILNRVFCEGHSRWSIVYDISNGKIYFRTDTNPEIRYFDTTSFDYSCSSKVLVLDINGSEKGDVIKKFTVYTSDINNDLVWYTYKNVSFLKDMPDSIIQIIASYPETTLCTE